MTYNLPRILALTSWLLLCGVGHAAPSSCDSAGVALQILGSGGPIADDGRASTAYVVWVDGQSKVLVDAGGGAFLRFGEAGARFDELDFIAVSHFHTDHVADLVTFLKTGFFSNRERALGISGPDAGGPFPSLDVFLNGNLGPGGAYAYLGGYLDGSGGLAKLEPVMLESGINESMVVYEALDGRLEIAGAGVPHGIVPAIAYRVSVGGVSLVFASDQNGNDDAFAGFAKDADVLVMHMVVPENVDGSGRALHAPPSRIGEIAAAANAKQLVLSHLMARSLSNLDENVRLVRQRFDGEIVVANDLLCITVN
jgi:ribonuclease BN (tRNA processing enzyme)